MALDFSQFGTPVEEEEPLDFSSFGTPVEEKEEPSAFRRYVVDPAISLGKGVVSLGESVSGLDAIARQGVIGTIARAAGVPTFSREDIGYRPEETQQALEQQMTPEQQAANEAVEKAEGVSGTLEALAENPSVIPHKIIETVPQMLGGGAASRGVSAASPIVRAATGEGMVAAGSVAESIRQANKGEDITPTQAGAAIAAGAGTTAFGLVGGKVAQKLGLEDVDTLLAKGASQAAKRGVAARVTGGALSEGFLEELPQSVQEQVFTNLATGKPWDEGVAKVGTMGAVVGAAMGGGANVLSRSAPESDPSDIASRITEAPTVESAIAEAEKILGETDILPSEAERAEERHHIFDMGGSAPGAGSVGISQKIRGLQDQSAPGAEWSVAGETPAAQRNYDEFGNPPDLLFTPREPSEMTLPELVAAAKLTRSAERRAQISAEIERRGQNERSVAEQPVEAVSNEVQSEAVAAPEPLASESSAALEQPQSEAPALESSAIALPVSTEVQDARAVEDAPAVAAGTPSEGAVEETTPGPAAVGPESQAPGERQAEVTVPEPIEAPQGSAPAEEARAAIQDFTTPKGEVKAFKTKKMALAYIQQNPRVPRNYAPRQAARGEWVLSRPIRERTAAQKANDARLRANAKRVRPDDDLATLLRKNGGINASELTRDGADPKDIADSLRFGAARKDGGMSLDAVAEVMAEHGYSVYDEAGRVDASKARELIQQVLDGEKIYTAEGMELRQAAADARRQADLEPAEDDFIEADESSPNVPRMETDAADASLVAQAAEIDESEVERLAVQFEGDDAGFLAAVKEFVDAANENDEAAAPRQARAQAQAGEAEALDQPAALERVRQATEAIRSTQEVGPELLGELDRSRAAAERAGASAVQIVQAMEAPRRPIGPEQLVGMLERGQRKEATETPADAGVSASEGRPALDLTGETESEIRAREALQKKEAEDKRKKDSAPGPEGFTLTGSDRPADEAEARGQKPMFARAQTLTEAFKRWFRDSKVVDENGEPLVVYHGTRADITEFQEGGDGIYLSSDAAEASSFSGDWRGMAPENQSYGKGGANVLPVYVALNNPLEVDVGGELFEPDIADRAIREAKAGGNDGVILRNVQNFEGGETSNTYIAFRPEQVKSATGNRGTFDAASRDILFARDSEATYGLTTSEFRSALAKAFGEKAASKLLDTGIITTVDSEADFPAHVRQYVRAGDVIFGFYDPKTDRAYAVPKNLSPGMVKGIALHEVGVHYGFERMLGEGLYREVMKRLDAMHKAGNKDVREAREAAEREAADPSQVQEETLAYLVTNRPEMSLVQRVISAIKAFLFREFGIGASRLTADDLATLARAAVMKAAEGNAPLISTEAQPAWHRAHHGSPHDFERFDISKIGTGEGAQAYGWGLYFASRKEVAEHYKKALARDPRDEVNRLIGSLSNLQTRHGDVSMDDIYYEMKRHPSLAEFQNSAEIKGAILAAVRGNLAGGFISDAGIAAYKTLDRILPPASKGRLYEVELAPKEEDYLDWDKPLSEQSEKVREAILRAYRERMIPTGLDENGKGVGATGEQLYKELVFEARQRWENPPENPQQAASMFLASIGIPGIKYLDGSSRRKGEGAHNYVIFDDKHVEIVAKFARRGASPIFYSELARQVEAVKTESAPAQQWAATIKGLKGVKADELEWSGVMDWLATKTGKVSKWEIHQFLEQNGVKVEEVMLGGGQATSKADELTVRLTALGFMPEFDDEGFLHALTRNRDGAAFRYDGSTYRDEDTGEEAPEEVADLATRLGEEREYAVAGETPEETRYSSYTLPGGENYRELLLTLPMREEYDLVGLTPSERTEYEAVLAQRDREVYDNGEPSEETRARLRFMRDSASVARDKTFRSSHFDQPNILAHVRFDERTDAEGKRVLFIEEIQSDWAQKGKREGFTDAALLARLQNEHRTAMERRQDATEPAIRALENATYLGPVELANHSYARLDRVMVRSQPQGRGGWRREWEFDNQADADLVQAYVDAHENEDRIERELHGKSRTVPSAPFVGKTEAWVALAVKRMIRYAAENGFERVAFTTGEQQAERYDLSKHVNSILYAKNPDATYAVSAMTEASTRGNMLGESIPEDKLADYVGKDVAERIIGGKGRYIEVQGPHGKMRELRGVDLKIGGEGMIAFYDRIVPNVVNDVLKKLGGGRVGGVTLKADFRSDGDRNEAVNRYREQLHAKYGDGMMLKATPEELARYRELDEGREAQPGFDITPEMREKALQGMPLFARRGARDFDEIKETPEPDKRSVPAEATDKALAQTPVAAAAKEGGKLRQAANRIHEALDKLSPLGTLKNQEQYLVRRYKALGDLAKIGDETEDLYAAFRDAGDQAPKVYQYLTTKDAKPEIIADAKLRASAVKAKETLIRVGEKLVEKGLLAPEAFEAHRGEYLPRIYLKHLLDDDAINALSSGKKPSDMGYLKRRKDIPEDVRRLILGEITDPAFLVSKAYGTQMRDIALLDWLEDISKEGAWILPDSLVEWEGKKVTPFYLKATARQIRAQIPYYAAEDKGAARAIADKMDETADKALGDYGGVPDGWKAIPDVPRYGRLRGMVVAQEIYDDIVGSARINPSDASVAEKVLGHGGIATKATQLWKWSKVAANPPAQIRNFVSNGVLLHLSGVKFHMVVPRVIQAIKEIRNDGQHWKVAKKYGVTESTFSAQELYRIERELLDLEARQAGPFSFATAKNLAGKVMDKTGDIYQFSEAIFKTAKIIDEMRKGKTEEQAVLEAQKWLFDYSLVTPSMRYLRNAPVGAPFITFYFKALPRLLEVATTHPLRLAPYLAIPYVLTAMVAGMADVDDDDVDRLKKALPEWLQSRGNAYFLPMKDDKGRWMAVDIGYFLPWTMWQEMGTNLASGKFGEAMQGSGLLGGPIPDLIAAIKTNKNAFTKKEIVNRHDPPSKQAASIMAYLWSMAMPTWLTEHGFAGHMRDAINETVNKHGEVKSTPGQATMRLFGVNLYPINPEQSRAQNIRFQRQEIERIKRRRTVQLRDRSLSSEDRKRIHREYTEMIRERQKELAKYAAESKVHPNLRTEAPR